MSLILGLFAKLGSFLARFRRKKTTIEQLEDIDKEMRSFEKYKQTNELRERKYIAALVLYSIVVYILGAFVYYLYLMPKSRYDQIKTFTPFILMPFIIYAVRKFLKWFFIKRANYAERRLDELKEKKIEILEHVKETETYKKAKEILEKFGDAAELALFTPPNSPNAVNNSSKQLAATQQPVGNRPHLSSANTASLVHRNRMNATVIGQQQQQHKHLLNQTIATAGTNSNATSNSNNSNLSTTGTSNNNNKKNESISNGQQQPPSVLGSSHHHQQQQRTLLPRPIIQPNRTIFDRVLDFIIGEGPNNRYALICRNCHFHNGMALKEEFEYIAFRCAYCLFYNEARKSKLTIPSSSSSSSSTSNLANNQQQNLQQHVFHRSSTEANVISQHQRSQSQRSSNSRIEKLHHQNQTSLIPRQQQQQRNNNSKLLNDSIGSNTSPDDSSLGDQDLSAGDPISSSTAKGPESNKTTSPMSSSLSNIRNSGIYLSNNNNNNNNKFLLLNGAEKGGDGKIRRNSTDLSINSPVTGGSQQHRVVSSLVDNEISSTTTAFSKSVENLQSFDS